MSSGRTTVTIYFVVFTGLILIPLVLLAPRPVWLGFLLIVVLLAVSLWAGQAMRRSKEHPVGSSPQPAAPVERRHHRITDVALPSAWADYDFLFSATVRWAPIGGWLDESSVNPEAVAVNAILERARKITQERQPARVSFVRHELSAALGRMEPEETGSLRAMAESVTLTLSEQDQARLAKLASTRKENGVWEYEMRYEQSRRAYLSENVLKDPGSAVVWWLAKNDDDVGKTVEDIGLLAQLSAAANNQHVPEPFRHLVPTPAMNGATVGPAEQAGNAAAGASTTPPQTPADRFDAFLDAVKFAREDPQRVFLAKQMAVVLRNFGKKEAADDLERRFDEGSSLFDDFDLTAEPPDDDGPRDG